MDADESGEIPLSARSPSVGVTAKTNTSTNKIKNTHNKIKQKQTVKVLVGAAESGELPASARSPSGGVTAKTNK